MKRRFWIEMARKRAGFTEAVARIGAPTVREFAENHRELVGNRLRGYATAACEAMAKNAKARELCMLPKDWTGDIIPRRARVELKYDGIPLIWTQDNGVTREGVPFNATRHLWRGLEELQAQLGGPHMIHGEYLNADGFQSTLADFRRGVGTGCLMVFDAVPLDVYQGKAPSAPLGQRRAKLESAMRDLRTIGLNHPIAVVRSAVFEGEALDRIELAAGAAWERGEEGIVVKDDESPYVREASHYWQRIKRRHTVDLPILEAHWIGDRLAYVLVEATAGVSTKIAVGMSERQRADRSLWSVGRIVEIRHLGLTNRGALRSASYLRHRDDKES